VAAVGILSDFSSNFLQLGKNLVGLLTTPAEKIGNSSRWLHLELKNNPQKVFLYFGMRIARGVDLARCIQGGGIPLDFLEGQDVLGDYNSLSTADLGMAIIQRMVIGGTFKGLGRIAKLAGKAKLGDFSKGVKLGSEKGFGGKGAAAKVSAMGTAKSAASGTEQYNTLEFLKKWLKKAGPSKKKDFSHQRETNIDGGRFKIIIRRDIGKNAHKMEQKGYNVPVDHYNIEVHKRREGPRNVKGERYRPWYNLHIVVDKQKNITKHWVE